MTHVEMTTTFGSITLELDSEKAPKTGWRFRRQHAAKTDGRAD
jgi:cyclophilin family peptidyl-prolyl cis-trans isomerase